MAELPKVSLTTFAKDTLQEWQKIVDKHGIPLNRHEMRTCLNLEIVMQQLINLVEDAEKQATAGSDFDNPLLSHS